MGTWLMPKGVGCCRPWRRMGRARICCLGWARSSLSESVSIRKTRRCWHCSWTAAAARRCARSAGHRQGAFAQTGQSASGLRGRCRLRSRGRHFRRRSEAFRCFRFRDLSAARRTARCPAPLCAPPPPPSAPLAPAGAPLRWAFRWFEGREAARAPGHSERPVQPVAAARKHIHRLVLRHAPRRGRCAGCGSGDHRLRGLDAGLPQPAPQCRGPGRVQSVVAQRLTGMRAPVVAVGQEGRPRELSWRPREGDPIVALVGGLERSRIDARVGQRRLADGFGCVRVIVEVEVARRVDRSVALGQAQGEGLALLDVPEDCYWLKSSFASRVDTSSFLG